MNLSTDRLHLRYITLGDLDQVHALHIIPETDTYNTQGIPDNIDESRAILQAWLGTLGKTAHIFLIETKEHDFIGFTGMKLGKANYRNAELWYKLHINHWNKGYATEVVNELLRLGFEDLQLHRIDAGCAVENIASAKVMQKAGMLYEGRKRKVLPIRGEWVDGDTYAILEEDYFSRKEQSSE
jgi:ribosomal-protein-alanine N-acetyltransferase